MVHQLLGFLLGQQAFLQVTFDVHVQEAGSTTEGHGGTVLGLDRCQVGEVGPLHGFFGGLGRYGDVAAIFGGHHLHLGQSTVLLGDLFAQTDGGFQVDTVFQVGLQGLELGQFVGHQEVDTVQGNTAVVTDDAATAVGIRQTGDDAGFAAVQDVLGVNVEHALVVGLAVLGEDLLDHGVQLTTVHFARGLDHLDTAVGDDGALERLVSLQTDDLLQALIDIAGIVSGNGGGQVGIKIDRRVSAVLDLDAFHDLVPQLGGSFGRASQEGLVTFIRGVVLLDEVTGVDRGLPFTGREAFPCFLELFVKFCHFHYLSRYLCVCRHP